MVANGMTTSFSHFFILDFLNYVLLVVLPCLVTLNIVVLIVVVTLIKMEAIRVTRNSVTLKCEWACENVPA